MGKAYIRPFAVTKPLNLQPPNWHDWLRSWPPIRCMRTFITISLLKAPPRPHAYVKYIDFVTFFFWYFCFLWRFFSRNRVAVEPSVAQTCMMAQTTRFHARRCLLGVSLMYACINHTSMAVRNVVRAMPAFNGNTDFRLSVSQQFVFASINYVVTLNIYQKFHADMSSRLRGAHRWNITSGVTLVWKVGGTKILVGFLAVFILPPAALGGKTDLVGGWGQGGPGERP
jgi:hypothetical protein